MNKYTLVFALLAPVACLGGQPHCFVNKQLAVIQPYYYTVQPQFHSSYTTVTDVESQLQNARNSAKLLLGLDEINNQTALQKSRNGLAFQQQLQALQAQPGDIQQLPLQAESSLDSQVSDIFRQNRCYQCHGEGKQAGVASNLQSMNELSRLRVFLHVAGGTMPKGGPPVAPDSAELIRRWAMESK